jgi:hypothetical protein
MRPPSPFAWLVAPLRALLVAPLRALLVALSFGAALMAAWVAFRLSAAGVTAWGVALCVMASAAGVIFGVATLGGFFRHPRPRSSRDEDEDLEQKKDLVRVKRVGLSVPRLPTHPT